MKQQKNNKYQGTKFNAFKSSGETVIRSSSRLTRSPVKQEAIKTLEKIPAYNTQGKEYKRILPKIRDQKIIDTAVLAVAINRVQPSNNATVTGAGIMINNVEITLKNGIALFKGVKLRFSNILELLDHLKQEQILITKKGENLLIRYKYSDSCLKH